MSNYFEITKKSMGEPVSPTFTENESKVKRNILIISAISLFLIYGIKSDAANPNQVTLILFFVRSNHIDFNFVYLMLLVALFYLYFDYTWLCIEYIAKWKIRVTGTKYPITKPNSTSNSNKNVTNQYPYKDYSDTPEQSNLYSYLMAHQINFSKTIDIKISEEEMERYQKKAQLLLGLTDDEARTKNGYTVTNTDKDYWYSILIEMRTTRELIQYYKKVFETPYLKESIRRFDKNFLFFQNSQYRRHLLFELFPTFFICYMGIINLLLKKFFHPSLLYSSIISLTLSVITVFLINNYNK